MTRVDWAVLGAGLAGLESARLLAAAGRSAVVLEASGRVGGLCRTERSGAWSWDIGPHAFYSKKPEAMARYRALPLAWTEHERRVRVFHPHGAGVEVGYPFENGLAELPLSHRLECVAGYLRAAAFGERPYKNLAHWIANGLGPGIARHFMVPYNRKIWDCPLEDVSMALVAGKIEPEPAWKVVRNALVPGTVGRAYQARFLYPSSGGAGAVPDAVAAELGAGRVRTGWPVASLARGGGVWRIRSKDGEAVEAGGVVSTIPIPELLAALGRAGEAAPFRANHTFMAAVGLKEGRRFARLGDRHWTFFAGPESFYRVTMMGAFDPGRLPVAVAEVTRKGPASGRDAPAVLDAVVADLLACGILGSEDDVGLRDCRLERYTYPLQTLGLPEARARLERALASEGVHLLGRSGRWDYLNTDGILASAAALARRLLETP